MRSRVYTQMGMGSYANIYLFRSRLNALMLGSEHLLPLRKSSSSMMAIERTAEICPGRCFDCRWGDALSRAGVVQFFLSSILILDTDSLTPSENVDTEVYQGNQPQPLRNPNIRNLPPLAVPDSGYESPSTIEYVERRRG